MKALERRVRLVVDRLVVHRLADRLWLLDRHREAEEAARRAEAEKAAVAARARAAAEAAEAARRRAAEPPVPTASPPVDVRPRVPSPPPPPSPTPHPYDPPEHMQIRPIRWGPSVAPYDPDDRVGRVLHEYDPLDRDDDYDLLDED